MSGVWRLVSGRDSGCLQGYNGAEVGGPVGWKYVKKEVDVVGNVDR